MELKYEVEGVETRLRKFDEELYGAFVGEEALYRSPTVSTDIQCEMIARTTGSERTVLCQLAAVDSEMELIRAERMAALSCGVSHLALHTEPLHHLPLNKRLVEVSLNDFRAIVLQKGYEALAQYSIWLADDMDGAIFGFVPEATEEFAVERRFKDFIHEARSQLVMIVLDRIACALESGEGIEKERELILLRQELREQLERQLPLLIELEKTVGALLEEHPELTGFMEGAQVLRLLLEGMAAPPDREPMGWSRKILLFQLLDLKLSCQTVLNSVPGGNRASVAFALRLAVLQHARTMSFRELLAKILDGPAFLRPVFQENLVRFNEWQPQKMEQPFPGSQLNPDFMFFID